ncbi:hypothetical protein [Streptomyces chryseus]|uniref:hypothetical protein n=1 Tax=Streptomyces chryseus TaxID=68186 RepID=UPI00110FD4B8|nr:hypothetical protein [Streptomyces chryseus]
MSARNGSQTRLTCTPAGNVDTYQDPAGVTGYIWNKVNKLSELKDPTGKVTTYTSNDNDTRTKTTPGGTVQDITLDKSSRPTTIKVTSPKGTLTNLSCTYESGGRMTLAKETAGTTLKTTWVYCFDAAGNLTPQADTGTCRGSGSTFTYNDASQLTAKGGVTAGWSYDKLGNETAGAATTAETSTAEKWSDCSQLTSLTVGGKTYAGQYGSTDRSERSKLGDTFFCNGPFGLSAKSTGGVRNGIQPGTRGHIESHDDRGLLPQRRARLRHGARRRRGHEGQPVLLQPPRRHPRRHVRKYSAVAPVRRRLPGPHRPLPPSRPATTTPTSAYGKCAAGFGTIGGHIAQSGAPALTGGLGTKASTPTCSGGLQVQF